MAIGQMRSARHSPFSTSRKTYDARLKKLLKQHEWGAITDEDFLAARLKIKRALDSLPVDAPVRAGPAEVLTLLDELGTVWDVWTPEQRAVLLHAFFAEVRIAPDGGPIEVVAHKSVFPALAAAISAKSPRPSTPRGAMWALLGSNQ